MFHVGDKVRIHGLDRPVFGEIELWYYDEGNVWEVRTDGGNLWECCDDELSPVDKE